MVTILSAACAAIAGWGFTVDDALISTRVAHHIATGSGYRFNPTGPLTDCVTPLGWAYLLVPFAGGGPWTGLLGARWLGVFCHVSAAGVLGLAWLKTRVPVQVALLATLPLTLCLPWGAWASAGMETPMVTLLCTGTLLGGVWLLPCASLAAALRPELIPWAFTLAVVAEADHPARRVTRVALVLSGPLLVALLRVWAFGSPTPLAVFAKPSDFEHGVSYVLRGVLLCGLPLLLLGWSAYARVDSSVRRLALGVAAHLGAIVVAGGDWMALFRLLVPLLPTCAFVGAALLAQQARWTRVVKTALATVICAALGVSYLASTRGVLAARHALVVDSADALSGRVVATLDVGWVGAVPNTYVVDLAGVTDPEVAWLPGGHTSKRLPKDFLLRRDVDALVLLLAPGVSATSVEHTDWRMLQYSRVVEQRVTRLEGAHAFVPIQVLPLGGGKQHYLILQRVTQRAASL